MPSDISIRDARALDVVHLAPLAAELVRQHHAVDPLRFFLPDRIEEGYAWWFGREVQRPQATLILAERAGEVLGYAYGALEERDFNMLLDRHGALHDIFVVEAARRSGVGQLLLSGILERLTALGAQRVLLSTMVSNESAQRLFQRNGFRTTMLEMTRESR